MCRSEHVTQPTNVASSLPIARYHLTMCPLLFLNFVQAVLDIII